MISLPVGLVIFAVAVLCVAIDARSFLQQDSTRR